MLSFQTFLHNVVIPTQTDPVSKTESHRLEMTHSEERQELRRIPGGFGPSAAFARQADPSFRNLTSMKTTPYWNGNHTLLFMNRKAKTPIHAPFYKRQNTGGMGR